MALSSLSLGWVSTTISNKLDLPHSIDVPRFAAFTSCNSISACSRETAFDEESHLERRSLLLGVGLLAANLFPASSLHAEEIPANYKAFVDLQMGIPIITLGLEDRYLQLQNVRVSFIPTDKRDIHDLGPMEEVVPNLVKNVYAAPNQIATILDMQEKVVDGKTITLSRRFYTLNVGANERRWKRVRNKLKVVADSFKVLDI
ncbi:Photosynthetic NDH subunit of lumenal location 1, chloroplastic [Vitis vinifera]|uniref:Photosynthetic NDH subunit of lumenal location 1, chloroplastic n=1 Tax=Vitis vinifera TaxID=29760 RepID=A0A438ENR7_VITVI|nr:Photosynthetic NDH subunit of lumenal location 1, chloroplastic [Vitis vinifera]